MFQFDGSLFHSCSVCATNRNPDGSLQEINLFNNLKHEDMRQTTEENTKKLQDAGYRVVRMRECTRDERTEIFSIPSPVQYYKKKI